MKKNEDDVASGEGIIYRKDQIKETFNCEDYNSPNITQEEIKLEILTQDEEEKGTMNKMKEMILIQQIL